MRRIVAGALALLIGAGSAHAAGTTSGSAALALSSLVGAHSPKVTGHDRRVLAAFLDGYTAVTAKAKILVKADTVSCRASDVDITHHDCTLKFGVATRTLKGREAHELYATLIENGVSSDGAAGSIFEALSHLACTIDPVAIKQKGGGGAQCSFSPGP